VEGERGDGGKRILLQRGVYCGESVGMLALGERGVFQFGIRRMNTAVALGKGRRGQLKGLLFEKNLLFGVNV